MWNDSLAGPDYLQRSSSADGLLTRRDWFRMANHGVGATALISLLLRDGLLQESPSLQAASIPAEAADPAPHVRPRVRRVIQLFMCGGMSHLDTFDYKPALARFHGQPLPGSEVPETFFGQVGRLRQSDWQFAQRGQSGLWISDLFPHLAGHADELTVVRSMVADSANHTPAAFQANTGFRLNGFPVLGSWLSYGLGCETDNLPAYVVLPDPRGLPAGGTINWTNGFLPARHQGVQFQTTGPLIHDLNPPRTTPPAELAATSQLMDRWNRRYAADRLDSDLQARVENYALAARLQQSLPEVARLEEETAETQQLYGLTKPETAEFGRSCLLARRLVERGVRFVQLFSGGSFGSPRINWDGHEDMRENHGQEALRVDQPAAALLTDLRQRGLLDETLVLFTTEFGRTPFTQSAAEVVGSGRDHNAYGFSVWLAGGGLRPGLAYGATDDIGWKAVENRVLWHDLHATILHLLGIDHTRLTYYHNGIQRRLTNVHGEVLTGILQ